MTGFLAALAGMFCLAATQSKQAELLFGAPLSDGPRRLAVCAGIALLLQPTLSFVWDVAFFARPMSAKELLGAAIALFAIYLGSRSRSEQGKAAA